MQLTEKARSHGRGSCCTLQAWVACLACLSRAAGLGTSLRWGSACLSLVDTRLSPIQDGYTLRMAALCTHEKCQRAKAGRIHVPLKHTNPAQLG